MPANLAAPGVYIEEVPSAVRTILGVSTSVTAFIGRTRRGPVNRAVSLASFGEFERRFGGLWSGSDLGHVVSHFFQNGGQKAVIVRVESGSALASASVPGDMVLEATSSAQALASFHHLRVTVSYGAGTAAYSLAIQAEDAANTVLQDAASKPYSVTVDANLGSDPTAALAAATTATTPPIGLARLSGVAPSARPATGATVSSAGVVRLGVPNAFKFTAADVGSWSNGVRITLTPDMSGDTFTLQVQRFDANGREVENELFYNLVRTPGAVNYVGDVLATRSALVRLQSAPSALPSTASATLEGGTDGGEPPGPVYEGSQSARTGLYALDDLDVVNLLCVPFPRSTSVVTEASRASFWSAKALPWCRARGAFAIIDPPPGWSNFDAVDTSLKSASGWLSNLRSEYGAQYFPEIITADPLQENRPRQFSPCGAIAGVIARTDGNRGVWKAPAGLEAALSGVLDLTVVLSDGEQGALNREGVNCLRSFPGVGRVVWGTRTLLGQDRSASEWKYVPVRRLASYLQQSLLRGTRWAVFEGNDAPLWAQMRLNIGAFMHQLFRQGAFAGRTPSEAYFVKCDGDTTTQADINAGIVNVIIGFAPVKPAEFVVIKIQQIAGQGI
jgi:phage tail sheath protein FI